MISRQDTIIIAGGGLGTISAFLPLYSDGGYTVSFFTRYGIPILLATVFPAFAAAVLSGLRTQPFLRGFESKIGFTIEQVITVLVIAATFQFTTFGVTAYDAGTGLTLGFLSSYIMLFGLIAPKWITALKAPLVGERAPRPAAAPAAPAFQPFWFYVSQATNATDPATGEAKFALNPGEWYLAVASDARGLQVQHDVHGTALVADTNLVVRGQ